MEFLRYMREDVYKRQGCSDDSDAFKGNAATADGIKNMVNLMDIDAYLSFHRNTDI